MRWVLLAAVLGGGCGKRINPAWCQQPENQSVSECGNIADAKEQSMACTDDPYCASTTPTKPYCDISNGVCVECLMSNQCTTAALPACTGNVCSACTQNSDCSGSTDFCDEGVCAQPSEAIIASPAGTNTGTDCSTTAPCTLLNGVAQAIAQGKILRLVPSPGNNRFTLTATLDLRGNIRITGEGTVIDGGSASPAIQISSGQDTFDQLEIENAPGAAIACVSGSLVARRLFVANGKPGGEEAAITSQPGCTIELDESVIYKNTHGALDVSSADGAPYVIHNSVFANNSGAPAVSLGGTGTFEYNTVVDNSAPTGTGGVTCTGGPALDMNIIANNDVTTVAVAPIAPKPGDDAAPPPPPPPPQQTGCDMGIVNGFTGYKVDLNFQGGSNAFSAWHLTPYDPPFSQGSPTSVVNIPNVICSNPPLHDIDGTLRPAHNRCDMGADECASCTQSSNQGGN